MFKQRLRKWGCRKNISLKHEDEETLRELFQQSREGGSHGDAAHQHHHHHRHRPTTGRDIQLANGQITTVDRLATHLRRKHDYYGRRQSNAVHSSSLPPHQKQMVPQQRLPTAPLRAKLTDPQTFRISEAVLHQVRTFILSRFKDDDQRHLAADGPKLVVQWRSYSEWLAYCNRIGIALRRRRLDEALREMRHGPEGILGILTSISGENQIPNVLGMLFYFFIIVTRQAHQAFLTADDKKQLFVVVRALVKYAAQASAQAGLPEIIIRLLQSIWYVDTDEMLFDLSNKAWQMTCQSWGSSRVPSSPSDIGPSPTSATTPSPPSLPPSATSPGAADTTPAATNNPFSSSSTATWADIFSSHDESSAADLLPRTDMFIASATSHLSRRTYVELLILHSSYLHSAIAAQERNPALDDRLLAIFQLVTQLSQDPSHLTSMYTQLLLAYHYRADWDAVDRYMPRLWWALRNAPNEYLRVWAMITVRGHIAKLTAAGETEKAGRMTVWLAEMEGMQDAPPPAPPQQQQQQQQSEPQPQQQQQQQQQQVLTPPPDVPEVKEEEGS